MRRLLFLITCAVLGSMAAARVPMTDFSKDESLRIAPQYREVLQKRFNSSEKIKSCKYSYLMNISEKFPPGSFPETDDLPTGAGSRRGDSDLITVEVKALVDVAFDGKNLAIESETLSTTGTLTDGTTKPVDYLLPSREIFWIMENGNTFRQEFALRQPLGTLYKITDRKMRSRPYTFFVVWPQLQIKLGILEKRHLIPLLEPGEVAYAKERRDEKHLILAHHRRLGKKPGQQKFDVSVHYYDPATLLPLSYVGLIEEQGKARETSRTDFEWTEIDGVSVPEHISVYTNYRSSLYKFIDLALQPGTVVNGPVSVPQMPEKARVVDETVEPPREIQGPLADLRVQYEDRVGKDASQMSDGELLDALRQEETQNRH